MVGLDLVFKETAFCGTRRARWLELGNGTFAKKAFAKQQTGTPCNVARQVGSLHAERCEGPPITVSSTCIWVFRLVRLVLFSFGFAPFKGKPTGSRMVTR